ncbi:MAG: hypothetical protein JXA01_09300 [Dehalococcoidia bacterium]|nr:hypothetical protein [Dehalococcoidia bacterium]
MNWNFSPCHIDSHFAPLYIIHMGKVLLIIACILVVLTIATGFLLPQFSDFIGPALILDIIIMGISVMVIAKETRRYPY